MTLAKLRPSQEAPVHLASNMDSSIFSVSTPRSEIELLPAALEAGKAAKGEALYRLSNLSGAALRIRLEIDFEGSDLWIGPPEEKEVELAPQETRSFAIKIGARGSAAPRLGKVKLSAFSGGHVESAEVRFQTPKLKTARKRFSIRAVIAGSALSLAAIGAGIQLSGDRTEKTTLADWRGAPLEKARAALEAQGLQALEEQAGETPARDLDFHLRIVEAQHPASDGALQIGEASEVRLIWRWAPGLVKVPEMQGLSPSTAKAALEAAGLTLGTMTEPREDPGWFGRRNGFRVTMSSPGKGVVGVGTQLEYGSRVDLELEWAPR